MPKSDTWPGGTATEPSSSNMDSAGSCDSVISTNSGFSVDSLQHLSAAERECLMYLEETIDSLDVDDDSGLSNDEPETSHQAAAKADHLSNAADQSGEDSERDQRRLLRHGVPTPLLLADGYANLPRAAPADPGEPKTPEVPNDSRTPPWETNARDLPTTHEVQDTDSAAFSPAPQAQMLASVMAGDLPASSDELEPGQSDPRPETDLILIPPPSDFMDEPEPQPQLVERPDPPVPAEKPGRHQHINLEEVRKRASSRRGLAGPEVVHRPAPVKPVAEASESPAAPGAPTSASLLPEPPEPKSPPAVAPKPKKLPSNIIFKSHKTSADANFSRPAGDGMMSDAQRVRMEALRKLGLLKGDDDDADQRPGLLSPNSRKSWAAPPSPLSPAARQTPPSPRMSSPAVSTVPVAVPSPPAGRVSPQAAAALTPPVAQAKDLIPVPFAFSDATELPSLQHGGEASPVKGVVLSERAAHAAVKSATLAHTGMGLSGPAAGQGSVGAAIPADLAELRNSRPRPASLGSGKDFSHVKVEELAAGASSAHARRSSPIPPVSQNAAESAGGVPRCHGVSVVICPRAEHHEGRRNALKKLGLLKD